MEMSEAELITITTAVTQAAVEAAKAVILAISEAAEIDRIAETSAGRERVK